MKSELLSNVRGKPRGIRPEEIQVDETCAAFSVHAWAGVESFPVWEASDAGVPLSEQDGEAIRDVARNLRSRSPCNE